MRVEQILARVVDCTTVVGTGINNADHAAEARRRRSAGLVPGQHDGVSGVGSGSTGAALLARDQPPTWPDAHG
jgi:hypothetical protein